MHERLQALTPGLFLALDHQGDRARRPTPERMPRSEGFDDAHDLSLVVDRTASDDALSARSLDDHWFKRRTRPKFQRVCGLYVVVAVVEDAWARGGLRSDAWMVRHDHRMADRLCSFRCKAKCAQFGNKPVRAASRLPIERRIRAHTRNTEEV